ncbi:MAG: hypothetical protein FWF58_01795 [Firmicutes bacterium]|nr:hypothetical protein [Bacillota bacterium]
MTIILYPAVSSYSEYVISFDFLDSDNVYKTGVALPVSSFSIVSAMNRVYHKSFKCLI